MKKMISCFAIFIFFGKVVFAQAIYTKSVDVQPLRVSYSSLQALIDKATSITAHSNIGVPPRNEQIVLKSGSVRITVPGKTLDLAGARIPDKIDGFIYSYTGTAATPITSVDLDFNDYRRTLTVRGASPEQVDAVFSATREDLNTLSTPIGGTGVKALLGYPLYMLFIFTIIFVFSSFYTRRRKSDLARALFLTATLMLLMFLPIDELLAGFLAVRGEPSFVVRFGPEIGFFGLLLAVISLPFLGLIFKERSHNPAE